MSLIGKKKYKSVIVLHSLAKIILHSSAAWEAVCSCKAAPPLLQSALVDNN
jgi:hypothetical protein